MNRVVQMLSARNGRKLLIPFFTTGFPSMAATLELVRVAADQGADIVELGMPFSDPMADGPQIQYSSQQALAGGINMKQILAFVAKLRQHLTIPIILMGYYNPIIAYGMVPFLRDAQASGVDGFIIPDLPVDEAATYCAETKKNQLSSVFLVSPTSTSERIKLIDNRSSDFVYAVTVTGVTGTSTTFSRETDDYLKRLKKELAKPFVAGFGVGSPDSARRLCRHADGVVIGSALVRILRAASSRRKATSDVAKFLGRIRRAI